jgi:hypothetical protein
MRDSAESRATQDINTRIAGRVRALRADLGLALDALAAKCDVSRSMLSLIERAGEPRLPRRGQHAMARSTVRLRTAQHLSCQLPFTDPYRRGHAAGRRQGRLRNRPARREPPPAGVGAGRQH